MFKFKTLLVERSIECPMCGHNLNIGDTMYQDDYRNEILCAYCVEDYKESVFSEEGEEGELVK